MSVDYDHKADFSALETWAWYEEPAEAARQEKAPSEVDPFTIRRARTAIEEDLSAKGFGKAAPADASFFVAVHSGVERHVQYGPPAEWGWTWGWGAGYTWGPYWDGYWGPPSVYVYHEAALIIDVLEPRPAVRLIWRGVARRPVERGLAPEERDRQVREAVGEVLAGFPPGRRRD